VSDRFDFDRANATLKTLTDKCKGFIKAAGNRAVESSIEYIAEARYRHQIWEIDLPLEISRFKSKKDIAQAREQFDRLHEEVFAFQDPTSEVEFVGWRATARCKLREGKLGKLKHEKLFEKKLASRRKAYFEGKGVVNARVLFFESMKPNVTVRGPAIVESPFTTVVIETGAKVVRKRSGSLVITP
jgi:N-methylhydantoinase A